MYSDLRQNKGTILKASVDYIRSLQEDQRKYRMVVEEKRKADMDLRKVLLRLNVSVSCVLLMCTSHLHWALQISLKGCLDLKCFF